MKPLHLLMLLAVIGVGAVAWLGPVQQHASTHTLADHHDPASR